ncbi:hypothetical protein ACTNDP_19920, partial [Paenibacillus barengoltzii]|uniref:hypothetical protein n=1 Tax=Paenibacillus barengoltzii TaxID=343517 RepID=UPI003F89178E
MTNIGKPYEGKPHVRFDEEGLGPAQPFTLALAARFAVVLSEDFLAKICGGGEFGIFSRVA